jgi:two-component system, chemotaxis family, chemotaxis protein CheY
MRTVLIVNDSKIERQKLIADLATAGQEFVIAGESADGIDAVTKFKRLKPDVVIMDVIMPGKSGLEACFDIVSLKPKANIILYTSIRNEAVLIKALDYGVKYFLPRDYEKGKLLRMVREIGI